MATKDRIRRRQVVTPEATGSEDPPIVNTYDQFVYNSSGPQINNRFNNWADLMVAITFEEGGHKIFFEQDETIPAGAYNLDGCSFFGNGNRYDAGGVTLTFGTGVTITSWISSDRPQISLGIKLLSTSNAPIFTFSGPNVFSIVNAFIGCTTAEFFKQQTTGGVVVFSLDSGAVLEQDGFEVFNSTCAAFATILVIAETGPSAALENNTLRSTNSVVYGELKQDPVVQIAYSTHVNLVIGALIGANPSSEAVLVHFTPAGSIASTTVQAAIEELDGDFASGIYTPTLTNVANVDASTPVTNGTFWFRVKDRVFVAGSLQVDPTVTATNTQLGISLPIASAMANSVTLSGVAASRVTNEQAPIIGDATNDRAEMNWLCITIVNTEFRFMFSYRVV